MNAWDLPEADAKEEVTEHYAERQHHFDALAEVAFSLGEWDRWQQAIGYVDLVTRAWRAEMLESPHWSTV